MHFELFKKKTHESLLEGGTLRLSIWRDKRLGMRVRNSFERSEQQRFRIFSAIQISDVFKIILQEGSLKIITVTWALTSKK